MSIKLTTDEKIAKALLNTIHLQAQHTALSLSFFLHYSKTKSLLYLFRELNDGKDGLRLLFLRGDCGFSVAALRAVVTELRVVAAVDDLLGIAVGKIPFGALIRAAVEHLVVGTVNGEQTDGIADLFRRIGGEQHNTVNRVRMLSGIARRDQTAHRMTAEQEGIIVVLTDDFIGGVLSKIGISNGVFSRKQSTPFSASRFISGRYASASTFAPW